MNAQQGRATFNHPALRTSSFDVALKLDMFGETTEQVVRSAHSSASSSMV